MPHLIESIPSVACAAIGIGTSTTTTSTPSNPTLHESSCMTHSAHEPSETHSKEPWQESPSDEEGSVNSSDGDYDGTTMDGQQDDSATFTSIQSRSQRRKKKKDLFSQLPGSVIQKILSALPPFQMLAISELSRKFYNFVVLGQEMNEVWFRLVKTQEAEQKKKLDWYKAKKLEQEQRQVQMMRSFSSSSTGSNYSNGNGPLDEPVSVISKQAQRLLNKKQEASGKATTLTVKAMRRNDRKKNWCQIYVDTILRGNGEDPLESLNQMSMGPAKKPVKFQTIVLNESLPSEHLRPIHDGNEEGDGHVMNKQEAREAKTRTKLEKRMYYKSIRSKPKGKKAGQIDSAPVNLQPWRQPEWSPDQDLMAGGDY